jgi:hypothetical protein
MNDASTEVHSATVLVVLKLWDFKRVHILAERPFLRLFYAWNSSGTYIHKIWYWESFTKMCLIPIFVKTRTKMTDTLCVHLYAFYAAYSIIREIFIGAKIV